MEIQAIHPLKNSLNQDQEKQRANKLVAINLLTGYVHETLHARATEVFYCSLILPCPLGDSSSNCEPQAV